VVRSINDGQARRGPDAVMVADADPFVLGVTRLAISDPETGANQPFHEPSGRFVAVFNGEIYNYRALVRDHGLEMASSCDGEVIARLWVRYGPECLELLHGMFAIAVADLREKRIFLARDPFGIKPLHWRRLEQGLVFGSEVRALWALDRRLPVDPNAVASFLRWGAVPADHSPFAGIETVAPGDCISFDAQLLARVDYRVPALADPSRSARTRDLATPFRAAVRDHLAADVPVALLLSAGADSAMIAAQARGQGVSLHCVTIRTDDGTDEAPGAAATASHYGHSHHSVEAAMNDDDFDQFFLAMQRPSIDGLNSFLINRAVRDAGFKVALSGLGADEALGGYRSSRWARALPLLGVLDRFPAASSIARRMPGIPANREKLARLIAPGGPRTPTALVELQRELFSPTVVASLTTSPELAVPIAAPRLRSAAIAQAELSRYLQPTLLPDSDAHSMAFSVELRVPFLDRDFFNAAAHRTHSRGKDQLIRQLNDPFLHSILTRPKTGFSVPIGAWLREGRLDPLAHQALEPAAPLWDHVNRSAVAPILARAATNARWAEPWALLVLDGWLRSLGPTN